LPAGESAQATRLRMRMVEAAKSGSGLDIMRASPWVVSPRDYQETDLFSALG